MFAAKETASICTYDVEKTEHFTLNNELNSYVKHQVKASWYRLINLLLV
jgi:hypothetical protein